MRFRFFLVSKFHMVGAIMRFSQEWIERVPCAYGVPITALRNVVNRQSEYLFQLYIL